jgi:cell division septation protein DedD
VRERIIGAIAIVVVAIIVIPWLIVQVRAPRELERTAPALPFSNVPGDAPNADQSLYNLPPLHPAQSATRAAPTPATNPTVASSSAAKADKSLYDLPSLNPAKSVPTTPTAMASAGSPARGSAKPQPPPAAGPIAAVPTAGWGVQAASFSSRKTAEALRVRLLQAGISAFLSPHVVGGTTYYRVMAGPYPSVAAARAKVSPVAAVSGTKAVVRRLDDQGG